MKRKTKTSKRAHAKASTDPLLRDIEVDSTQLYHIVDVTESVIARAKRQPRSARKIAIMHPCPGCGPQSTKSIGIPLWVDSPVLMSVTCLAGHEYVMRILPPLVTETTFRPRVEFYTDATLLTEEEAQAEIALHEAEAQERTARGPVPLTP